MLFRLFAIAVFVLALGPAVPARADDFASRFVTPAAPQPAPDLTFSDGKGELHTLKDYQGRFVLLNLWATWCSPCVEEMPSLNALQERLGPHVNVIALNEDRNGIAAASAFMIRHGLKHLPVFVDVPGQAPSLMHVRGLPTTFLIDPQGMIVGSVSGDADWMDPATLAFLKAKMKS